MNHLNDFKFEIKNWLRNHGYFPRHVFVVDKLFVNVSTKLSDEDILKFNRKFDVELKLNGGSFNEDGTLDQVEYVGYPERIEEFRRDVKIWLDENEFPVSYFILSSRISLHCSERLSSDQISDFSDMFNVKCKSFDVSCNSNDVTYRFSWGSFA